MESCILQQVMEVRTCVLHSFDSLIEHLGLLCGENPSDKFISMYSIAGDHDAPGGSSFSL